MSKEENNNSNKRVGPAAFFVYGGALAEGGCFSSSLKD